MKHPFRYFLLLLAVCAQVHSHAQKRGQAAIDSMLKDLPGAAKEDTNKVKLLYGLANAYCTIDPDKGISYAQQAIDLAKKLEWGNGRAAANSAMGTIYINKSDYARALQFYQAALALYEETHNTKGRSSVTGNIGNVYYYLNNYPRALEYYYKTLKMSEEAGSKNGIANATGNIGRVYEAQSDLPKALEYYLKAAKLCGEAGNKTGVAISYANIGGIYFKQNEDAKALQYFLDALKIQQEIGNKNETAVVTGDIAAVYERQKDHKASIEYNQRSLKMAEEVGNKYVAAGDLCNMGSSYLSMVEDSTGPPIARGNKAALLRNAIDCLQRGLALGKEINSPVTMAECYHNLEAAYKLNGDYKKALECVDNYHAINDSTFSKETDEKIVKQAMNFDFEKIRLTDSLKTAEREKVAHSKLQRQRNYTYIGIGAIALLLAFSFFIVKERGKSEKLLLNILPAEVAAELKRTGATTAKHFNNVTVLFTDFVNFTDASAHMSAQALIDELHACFKAFDEITGKYKIEKIKTIGDAYLAVAGLPTADPLHAEHIVKAAIEINAFMHDRLAKLSDRTFEIRIGVNTGSIVAGVVGVKKFAYDIWGDTVNIAARMEQTSEHGKINISATTYELVKDKFNCIYRGEIDAKGKGQMKMYFVS